jgi:hypothetical protein
MPKRNTPIKRFPRIPKSFDCGKVTRLVWQTPEFEVRQTDNSTEFVHRLGFLVPERVRTKQVATFTMLFSTQTIDIKSELEGAYARASYKGIPVARLVDTALRSVLTEALSEIFMKAKKSKDPHAKYMKGGRKTFAKAARPRRLPKTEFRNQRAIRLARLYERLVPQVKQIYSWVAALDDRTNESELREKLEERFSWPWIAHVTRGEALQNLPEIPGYSRTTDTLGGLEWTVRQLTVGVICCIEHRRRALPSLNATTILEEYIPLGRKLLKKSRASKRRFA